MYVHLPLKTPLSLSLSQSTQTHSYLTYKPFSVSTKVPPSSSYQVSSAKPSPTSPPPSPPKALHLSKCEPNYNIWFADSQCFELSTDISRMKRSIERHEGKTGFERYLSFLQESHRHYEISVAQVLKRNFTSLLSMLRPSFLRHLLELHPFESIYSRASKYFWTERLRRVLRLGVCTWG